MKMIDFKRCQTWSDANDLIKSKSSSVLEEFVFNMEKAKDILGELTMRDEFILNQAKAALDIRYNSHS